MAVSAFYTCSWHYVLFVRWIWSTLEVILLFYLLMLAVVLNIQYIVCVLLPYSVGVVFIQERI